MLPKPGKMSDGPATQDLLRLLCVLPSDPGASPLVAKKKKATTPPLLPPHWSHCSEGYVADRRNGSVRVFLEDPHHGQCLTALVVLRDLTRAHEAAGAWHVLGEAQIVREPGTSKAWKVGLREKMAPEHGTLFELAILHENRALATTELPNFVRDTLHRYAEEDEAWRLENEGKLQQATSPLLRRFGHLLRVNVPGTGKPLPANRQLAHYYTTKSSQ